MSVLWVYLNLLIVDLFEQYLHFFTATMRYHLLIIICAAFRRGLCSKGDDGIFHHYPLGDPRNCLQPEAVRMASH